MESHYLKVSAQLSSLIFGLSLHILSKFVYVSSTGTSGPSLMYQNLMLAYLFFNYLFGLFLNKKYVERIFLSINFTKHEKLSS